jgi:FdhE protein
MAVSEERLLILDRRVAALKKSRPELTEALDLQAELIRAGLTSARPAQAQPFALPREHLTARVRQGVPMLHDQPALVDIHFAADLFSRLVNVLQQRDDPELQARLRSVAGAAEAGRLDPERLFGEGFVQHQDHLAEIARAIDVDAELLATLAAQATAPLLRAYAHHLLPLIERADDGSADGAAWQRGYCPICGGWPMLGELRGVELAQYLRCGACGSGWRWPRLSCPYCANDDYQSLHTLTVDGEQRFRISICELCQGYLKIGNAFDPPSAELLPLDDAATLHLDVAAIERGYRRPVGSGFAIELALPEQEWLEELV